MTRYRKVEVGTWHDRRFRELSAPPPNGQTLWFYLLTGPRTTVFPGLVIATLAVMADDLRWPLEHEERTIRTAWHELAEREMATADFSAGVIVLPKALLDRRNVPRETSAPNSPNVLRGWRKAWGDVPECALKDGYLMQLQAFAKALGQAYEEAFAKAFADAIPTVAIEVPGSLPRPARARTRGPVPVPDPVPDPVQVMGVLGQAPSADQPPPMGSRADRDQAVSRGDARAAGHRVPPAPPIAEVHGRAKPPVPQAPLHPDDKAWKDAALGSDDVRARQRLVQRFREAMADARRKAAAKHFLTGVRFDLTLHGGENESELRQRLKDAGGQAEAELEHVIAVAAAEALARPESLQWLGWNLGRSRSWDRALRTPLELAGAKSKSVFDVVDDAVAEITPPTDGDS